MALYTDKEYTSAAFVLDGIYEILSQDLINDSYKIMNNLINTKLSDISQRRVFNQELLKDKHKLENILRMENYD